MGEGDERPARVVEDDAREVPAGGGKGCGTELAVHGAQVSPARLEEHARAARLDAEHRRGTLGQRSAVREEPPVSLPAEMHADAARTRRFSIGIAQPAVQQAPACWQR